MNYIFFNRTKSTQQHLLYKAYKELGVLLRIQGEYIGVPAKFNEVSQMAKNLPDYVSHITQRPCVYVVGTRKIAEISTDGFEFIMNERPEIQRLSEDEYYLVFPVGTHIELIKTLSDIMGGEQHEKI